MSSYGRFFVVWDRATFSIAVLQWGWVFLEKEFFGKTNHGS